MDRSVDVLPIPICWIARALYNLWVFSFRFRRNSLEHKLVIAYDLGQADGHSKGHNAGYEKGLLEGIDTHKALVSEAATELKDLLGQLFGLQGKEVDV